MPFLLHESGPDRGKRFPLERTVQLGRGPLADLEVRDAAVSRRHAQISVQDGRCFLSDLGSGNGTWLNGVRLTDPKALTDGDEIRLGGVTMVFVAGDQRAPGSSSTGGRRAAGRPDRTGSSGLRVAITADAADSGSRSVIMPFAGLKTHGGTRLAEEVARLQRRLDFFRDASRILARTLDQSELLDELLGRVMAVLPQADRAFIVLWQEETNGFVPLAARTRDGSVAEIPASQTLLAEVVRKREALVSIDAAGEEEFAAAKSIHLLDLRAVACVPLLVEDRVLGVLQLDNDEKRSGFGEADLDLLAGLAGPIALAIEHSRLHREMVDRQVLEHDLALARRIQKSFLPARPPQVPGWRIVAEYSPAHQVGGDLYDFIPLPDGRICLAIGDVSGKGVSGALLMARLTSALRAAVVGDPRPSAVLAELNQLVAGESDEGMFVTFAYGVLDPVNGRIQLANAGHPSPLVRALDGQTSEFTLPAGTPLGVRAGLVAETVELTLASGELLVLFTDGLSEAATPDGQRFEVEGILTALRASRGSDPRGSLDAILHAARSFVSTRGFDDDLTVVCLGRQ